MKWVWEACGHSDMPFPQFVERATRGYAVARLCRDLIVRGPAIRSIEGIPDTAAIDRRAARAALYRQIDDPALRRVPDLLLDGRSAVLVASHAGVIHALRNSLFVLPANVISVGNGRGRGGSTLEERNHMSTGDNVEIQFLKLVKLLRREAMIAFIVADGNLGGEHIDVDLFGRSIPFSPGAGFLARHASAPLVFTYARWEGDRLVIHVDDPVYLSREAVGEDWREAYAMFVKEKIEKILSGPPEYMRMIAGLWFKIVDSIKEARKLKNGSF